MIVVIRYMAKISEFDPEAVQYAAEFARFGQFTISGTSDPEIIANL